MDLDENYETLSQPLVEDDRLVSSTLEQEEDVSVGSRDELKRRQVPTLVFIMVSMIVLIAILFTAVVFIPPAPAPVADKSPLRVFVLAGQSNMVGHGFISKKDGGKELNGTLESLISMYPDQFGMLKAKKAENGEELGSHSASSISSSSWTVREDVLIVCNHQEYDDPSIEEAPRLKGKLYAGMCGGDGSQIHMGPELGFGWSVGDALNSNEKDDKILIVKIAWGGKSLEVDFRPPSSGNTGPYYTTMIHDIKTFLASVGKYFPEEYSTLR